LTALLAVDILVQKYLTLFKIVEQAMPKTPAPLATSLIKALRVLYALEHSPEGRGVTDLARTLDLPKSAVHRLLVTFQELGFVQQQHDSRYILGPGLARLGLQAADMFTPRRVARPYLETLAQEIGETVFLGLLVQDQVLVVDKVEHGQVLRVSPALGTVLPLHRTALGKVLLAFRPTPERQQYLQALESANRVTSPEWGGRTLQQELAAIVRQGFAVSLEEWTPDICCLAAPIRPHQGAVSAALALALPRSRMPQPQRHDPFAAGEAATQYPTLLPALLTAVERISAALP
jgi:IclR family transcriptional regulator, KDG regulon repressor